MQCKNIFQNDIHFEFSTFNQVQRRYKVTEMQFSTQTYGQFLETIPDAALVIARDGKILLANGRACVLFIHLSTGPEKLNLQELVSEAHHEMLARSLEDFWNDPVPGSFDLMFLRSDGSEVPTRVEIQQLELREGLCAICIVRDLTEFNRSIETLMESEERYHMISAVASDYMFSTRVHGDGKLVLNWVAGAFEAITGFTFDDYIAHGGWRSLIYPEDLALDDRHLEKLKRNQPVVDEIRTLHKDGRIVWVRIYAHPVWNAKNQVLTGIYGAVQDITERKRAEEIISASEKRLTLIFDAVNDVIFLLTVESEGQVRFAAVNQAFLATTGLRREQVIGQRVGDVLPQASSPLVIERYNTAVRENKTIHWDEASENPTGKLVGEVTITPYRNEEGKCTHLVGSVHDITEIRRAEAEITKLNQELEQRVAERTEQLQTANKELESFSYSVSHDLRAPLRAINGFASIIARRHRAALNAEGQHYVDNVVLASERMGLLIDDLLTYSRIGRAGVRHEPVPLEEIMGSIIIDLETRLQQIHGILKIEDPLPVIIGDRTVVYQIFSNLIENAMTYRKSDVPLKILVSSRSDSKKAMICVSDNGIGIPSEYFDKIFNIFQRLHSDDEYPGTGIGLATVKKSVELLGGSVWVESRIGEGSNFFVKLPRNGR